MYAAAALGRRQGCIQPSFAGPKAGDAAWLAIAIFDDYAGCVQTKTSAAATRQDNHNIIGYNRR